MAEQASWSAISMFILIPVIGILLLANGWFLKKLFGGLETKITAFCKQNAEDHREMWRVIHTHGHTCCDEKNPKVYTVE